MHLSPLLSRIALVSGFLSVLFSCRKPEERPPEYPDWTRIEIPTGMGAYAIAGSLDQTLLVTTITKAFYSSDRGKTWQFSKDFQGPIPALLTRNDTVSVLIRAGWDSLGVGQASGWDYFTLDFGESWDRYARNHRFTGYLYAPYGVVESRTGVRYRLKKNQTPTSPGSTTSFYVNPSEIIREDGTGSRPLQLPFKAHINNLHLDARGYLYLAASGGAYLPEKNGFLSGEPEVTPAIVFVSKLPLP